MRVRHSLISMFLFLQKCELKKEKTETTPNLNQTAQIIVELVKDAPDTKAVHGQADNMKNR